MSTASVDKKTLNIDTALDINKIRQDFPILQQKINDKPLVYLDNAATSQKPKLVIDAISDYYESYNANVHRGVHRLSEKATHEYEQARIKAQRFINAEHPSEIIFLRGTTEAVNLVAQSFGPTFFEQGDEIIITEMEHHSNIVPWQLLCERLGTVLKVVPINDAGEICIEDFKQLITPKTKFVSVIHISNALGTINPIKEMIDIAHQLDIPVMIDGAQSAPHLAIDVQALDCDFYACSSHKLFGPTGVGFLYGKQRWLEKMPPYQGGGEMIQRVSFTDRTTFNELPHKFEAGTPHIAGAIAMGKAIDYITTIGMAEIADYEHQLLEYATAKATQVEGLTIIGTAQHKASILSFTLDKVHPHDIGTLLDQQGIAIRTGHHCAMPIMQHFGLPATARASFAFYNTPEEIDVFFAALARVREVFI